MPPIALSRPRNAVEQVAEHGQDAAFNNHSPYCGAGLRRSPTVALNGKSLALIPFMSQHKMNCIMEDEVGHEDREKDV
jgi:hypothetical protein